ncbi:MAG TPA: malectin domain-containing carbohydrate-binding protein [Actinocrinis sp.]|uniref:malectin domain-containing carbohydrate-binding protein n=1 Tax=Actinocrinis sp. TaxID=1920516 RepID=UPI002DDCDF41|nr:malectin domain-containing carbohydrate-binding protein [Actinocrinis sp.]HEV3172898.1 malectin domain-containing carbohydrate-binding protein [Actinocrinis sp.]
MRSFILSENSPKRWRSAFLAAFTALLMVVGMLTALDFATTPAHAATLANTAVTTHRNDNEHDGQYSSETILNTSNVNSTQFGKRVTYPVDGQTYAQPLYMPNITIGGAAHNVVYAATENDSVYAFDADADTTSPPAPLWHVSLLPAGAHPVPNSFNGCGDLQPIIGITSTPVIDPTTNTMFVVAYDQENGNEVYRLHALDITTGADKWPAVVIAGSTPGTGVGSSGGNIAFNASVERQRSALMLANSQLYVTFTSFCDIGDYHGFIFGYNYSNNAFTVANIYDDTPNGSQGGIWGGGAGLSADASGNLYFMSGNGTFDADSGGPDMGQSFVKLNASLQRTDYFAPFTAKCGGDNDLGSGGPLVIPSANEVIGAGKEGRPYVVSTTNMGGYTADPNLVCYSTDYNRTDVDKIVQEMPPGTLGSMFSTPGFYNGPNGRYVYFSEDGGPTVAYSFSGGKLSATPTSKTPESFGGTGGDAVASSNGTAAGTGIVWIEGGDSVLRAYDATNLGTELYNSNQNASRDGISGYVKFTSAVVTNGQVFVGLSSSLAIFGEIGTSSSPPPAPNGVQINAGGPAVAPFAADEDFSGGSTSATGNAINLSGVTNPAPMAVYQTNRFGTFGYSVGGLPTTGSYTVRLHFAEEYWTTTGSRLFNVVINGSQVLTDFDILATAGAEYKAVVEQFDVASNSSGRVTIQFNTVKDNAQVNGIEIIPSNSSASPSASASASPSAPPPPPPTLQINAGGPAVAPFVADEDFANGATAATGNTINLSGVSSPAPMAVYQTNRYGNFTYTIPGYTAGSSHTVRLDFAEEYWTTTGARLFNVVINGMQVLTSFDILATAGGEYKAVDEQFTTTANSSGQIIIQFVTVKDNAQVNGIEIS